MLAVMGRKPKARVTAGQLAHPLLLWRERYGVQQKDLAAICGISQATLSKIENWIRVPLGENLERLMCYTHLPTDAFIRPRQFLDEHPDFLAQTHGPC